MILGSQVRNVVNKLGNSGTSTRQRDEGWDVWSISNVGKEFNFNAPKLSRV